MSILSGKHALVTGGATGVGAAIAVALADAGAAVTIAGRGSSVPQDCVKRAGIDFIAADVTSEQSVTALFRQAHDRAGPADIVIANAGAAESAPLKETGLELWQRMMAVNLTGVFLTLRSGLAQMRQLPWGRAVVIASTAGLKGYPYVSAYCAAKHGAIGLVRALAAETARGPVTVNAVCPGFADTDLLARSIETISARTGMSGDDARALLMAGNPQGRFIEPREVARTVLWLCGPDSGAITGQAISVSGGET